MINSLSYQQWDAIADAYIPGLALLVVARLAAAWRAAGSGAVRPAIEALLWSLLWVYGLMWVDRQWALWPRLGLDYSTHTALALVWVVAVAAAGPRSALLGTLSMLAYAGLMRYQHYHSVLDMLSTALVVLPPTLWLQGRAQQALPVVDETMRNQ